MALTHANYYELRALTADADYQPVRTADIHQARRHGQALAVGAQEVQLDTGTNGLHFVGERIGSVIAGSVVTGEENLATLTLATVPPTVVHGHIVPMARQDQTAEIAPVFVRNTALSGTLDRRSMRFDPNTLPRPTRLGADAAATVPHVPTKAHELASALNALGVAVTLAQKNR